MFKLRDEDNVTGFAKVPLGVPARGSGLRAASQTASVFDGMGWWKVQEFDHQGQPSACQLH
jgi:hypothetical protein